MCFLVSLFCIKSRLKLRPRQVFFILQLNLGMYLLRKLLHIFHIELTEMPTPDSVTNFLSPLV